LRAHDFVIVGSGIIGLTVAYHLRERFPLESIAVLEKEPLPGAHASGRNSGILHSGIYYGSDTLKARYCAEGAARMRAFAEEHRIPCLRTGKVIVASSEAEWPVVDRLMENAERNAIRAFRLDEAGVREIEPHARSVGGGIHVPYTAAVDTKGVIHKLVNILRERNVEFLFGRPVLSAEPLGKKLRTPVGMHGFGLVFNCAGAHADRVARAFGVAQNYAVLPFKGLYYRLRSERRDLVKGNIYPIPDLSMPFLGVHLSRTVSGDVYVGPTAIPALGRENYGIVSGARVGEAAKILGRLADLYWRDVDHFRRMVHNEVLKYLRPFFLRSVQRLVPAVTSGDIEASGKVGIRPQLVNRLTGRIEMDFVVERTPESVHVLNAISPAFTSAFAFSEMIVESALGMRAPRREGAATG
jgi:L-2-hydroxyglutarate oxidase LhgO